MFARHLRQEPTASLERFLRRLSKFEYSFNRDKAMRAVRAVLAVRGVQ